LRALDSPETTVSIILAEPCPAALATLRSLGDSLAASAESSGTTLVYRTRQPTEVNPRAIERLVAAGARIVSVTCATRSLEEVYAAVIASGQNEARR
jgi:hypothetical protein